MRMWCHSGFRKVFIPMKYSRLWLEELSQTNWAWWRRHSPLNVDGSTLWLAYMLKQLLGNSLMEILKPGCPRNVESGETSLSWLYLQSIGSQCKIKDQRYCVGSKGPWKSLKVTLSIKNTWPSILGVLVTEDSCSCQLWCSVRDGGADVGQQEQPGGEAGTLAHLLTHSVSHCHFMFQTLQQLVRMVLYLGCKGQRAVIQWPNNYYRFFIVT